MTVTKPEIRSKSGIIELLAERARSYTPEWSMSVSNPDIASALAEACADMFAGTVRKINMLPLKNEIAFFNMLNASLLSASPSEGYVSFSMSADDVGNAAVEKGTVLSAYSQDGDTIHFETSDDILVSPARIEAAFCVDDAEDIIGRYDDICGGGSVLFDTSLPNLQTHILKLGHPFVFDIRTGGKIFLQFFRKGGIPVNEDYMRILADSSVAVAEYYAGEELGYLPFTDTAVRNGKLLLLKDSSSPRILTDEEGISIRFTVRNVSAFDGFSITGIEAFPAGGAIAPDVVTDGNMEYDLNGFYPFGERFRLFDEVYFGCGEVLDKRGAQITLSFDMVLDHVPIEGQTDEGINWKWIASKGDFKEPPSYRITITEVIWEYYNGFGWARLFPDRSYSDIFGLEQGVEACFRSITFTCPDDMCDVFVGARQDYYIRARIIKADNLYKLRGNYLSPFLRNLSFDYRYDGAGCRITDVTAYNCVEEKRFDPVGSDASEGFLPFIGTGAVHRAVYLGFSAPPDTGPYRILWNVNEELALDHPVPEWEYYTERGWRPMNVIDETEGFTKVGLTIFLDDPGFVRRRFFGEELFWVRISDSEDRCRSKNVTLPVINSAYYNTVRAVNVDSHREEYFTMSIYTENPGFDLASGNVLDFALYVNEVSTISEAETEKLRREGRIIKVSDSSGILSHVWVKWDEVTSFITGNNTSRSYVLDRTNGRFSFGNGRKGRIPAVSDSADIRVVYTTGGGARTNVEKDLISGMERSIGFVSSVTNHGRFFGGRDAETIYDAITRNSVMLRTQGKAVTADDFEQLALYASESVRKARCISGMNASGEPERGAVTLVVMKEPGSGFGKVSRDIKEYLLPRLPSDLRASGRLYIVEPVFIVMNVRAVVTAEQINGIFDLRRNIEDSLRDYIAAYCGKPGGSSWNLGMIPNEQQIRSVILHVGNVTGIRSLSVTTYLPSAGGLKETDDDELRKYRYILPENGHHEINVTTV